MAQVLIIDDHDSVREGLELLLRRRGHQTRSAASGKDGLALLDEAGADLVITDLKMAHMDGLAVLEGVKERAPHTDVLLITAFGTVEKAVEAMKLGASDFVTKPFSSEEFAVKVERLLSQREERETLRKENVALRVENAALKEDPDARYGEMVGESEPMRQVFRWVERVARSDSTVMIYGESGTGKELVARAVHAASHRRNGPFVRVNMGALTESLMDSELFGHEKGAFTGAERRRRGRFELANGGTLFLDEITTITPATQVRLLRVLQERELERVGGEETIAVDVRIIAATNTSPERLLASGDFREDLFYRLHVLPLTLPPLRERPSDVPVLVDHFIQKLRERTRGSVRTVSPEALEHLKAYAWPGNVRELENVVERALVLAEGDVLGVADLPPLRHEAHAHSVAARGSNGHAGVATSANGSGHAVSDFPLSGVDLTSVVEGIEERLVREALDRARGVKAEAARLLGLKPSALYYKLEKYGIEA